MPATALDPRTALVVIDLQRGLAAYPVPTVHPLADVVANARRLAEAFRQAALPVVLVTVGFSPDGQDRALARTETPPRPTPTDPLVSQVMPELGAQPGDLMITKRQPNAFYGTELDLQLRRRKVTGIVLAGVATSAGVDTTARAAHERSYNVTFASDAITDMDRADEESDERYLEPNKGEWRELLHVCETENLD